MNEDLNLSYDSQMAILLNTLSKDSFLMVNTRLCVELTIVPTVVLSLLVSRQKYFDRTNQLKVFPKAKAPKNAKFFYATYDSLRAELNLGYRAQTNAIDILEKKEFIFCHRAGLPSVKYYSINPKKMIEALSTLSFTSIDETAELDYAQTAELDSTKSKTNNIKENNIKVNKENNKENKNKEIFEEDLNLDFDLNLDAEENDFFLLRENTKDTAQGLESIGSLGKNSPEFLYKKLDENGNILKQSNNPHKIFTKEELLIQKGFISDLTNDYYPIDETYLPIQDNEANERFRAKYPPLYPKFGNYMNIYQSCLRDFSKNEAKGQLLFEQLYPEKIQWNLVRSKKGIEPIQKEDINEDFLKDMEYSTTATLMYFGLKYEAMGKNTDKPTMKYTEIWVPIYPYSYLEKQAAPRLKAFLNTASNVPNYYKILTDLIKQKEKK